MMCEKIDSIENKVYDQTNSIVRVVNADLLYTAESLIERNLDVIVGFPCSPETPGGDYREGKNGLESDIFNRTDIVDLLDATIYPLNDKEGLLYKNVSVVRDIEYNPINTFKVDMFCTNIPYNAPLDNIGAHPNEMLSRKSFLRRNAVNKKIYSNEKDLELMKYKIDMLFQTAVKRKKHAIVVDSFGCYKWNNPPCDVIWLFNQAIKRYPIKIVVFSILVTPGTHHIHNLFHQWIQ